MKHYLFVTKMSPENIGGVEVRTYQVAQELCARGHRVTILCAKTSADLPKCKIVNGIEIQYKKTLPDFWLKQSKNPIYQSSALFHLFSPLFVLSYLRYNKVDLIRDSMSPLPALGLLAYKLPLLKFPTVVAVLHQLYGQLTNWIKHFGLTGIAGYFFQEALKKRRLVYEQMICDGQWVKDYLTPSLGDTITHIPNGVEFSKFQIVSIERETMSVSEVKILNVGRFVSQKGHKYLLSAIQILVKRGLAVKLFLAGDGPLFEDIQQRAIALNIKDNVIFLGHVSRSDVPALFASTDIFVLPSLIEGMPNTILEALASGIPIVSTDIPAIREILNNENSILVEPANELSLANGIQRLIEDKILYACLKNTSKKLIQENYDWGQLVDQEIAIYDKALN